MVWVLKGFPKANDRSKKAIEERNTKRRDALVKEFVRLAPRIPVATRDCACCGAWPSVWLNGPGSRHGFQPICFVSEGRGPPELRIFRSLSRALCSTRFRARQALLLEDEQHG